MVVARRYLGSVPHVDVQGAGASELDEGHAPPGHIYVPSPSSSQPTDESDSGRGAAERPADEESQTTDEAGPATPEEPKGSATEEGKKRGLGEAEKPPVQPLDSARDKQPAEEPSDKTYSIQVGMFTNIQGARQVMDDLTRAGYPSRVAREKRGSQDMYRVVTGRYRSEYAARKALEQLRNEGFEAFLIEK